MNAKLEESAQAEFEEIVAEREAVEHLNELDRLVNEARERKDINSSANGDGAEQGEAYVSTSTLCPYDLVFVLLEGLR